MKKAIFAANGPKPIAPYSPAVEANGFVFVSGQVGSDPATGKLAEGITAQTEQALKNVQSVLAAAGLEMADVAKATVFLADIKDFAAMNEVYKTFFTGDCPARSAFQVGALPGGASVEIEVIAAAK